ncbi:myelin-oligodendrocyte glycoprotein-like isoform X1 [Thunnus albacares]|uniref:myelin-oligodendrocyte glycoprotein-like isoform X1 n=2 Tax=Thunnus albacares TaxID=8236 RepID=UPI001CF64632|nr:myelin-oligodendrocyte glycoprotein-like isoform X1 [Thunnus albacares]
MNYEFLYSCPLSPLTIRLTVVLFLLLFAYTPAKGQPQVIGSLQPIMAAPGDSVILPCHVEPPIDVRGRTVEWSRPDRKPDPRDRLSRVEYVHLYRDNREVPDMKIPSYVSRTELFTDGLRQGNISLKIINVTLADEGRYRCFIPKLKSTNQASIVHLVIEPNYAKNWTTEMPLHPRNLQTPDPKEETDIRDGWSSRSRLTLVGVICVLLILSIGVGGYRLTQKHPKQTLHQSL